MGADSSPDPVDRDLLESYAKDAMKIFQLDIIILSIILPTIFLAYEQVGFEYMKRVGSSIYTITGTLFWMGSLLGCLIIYRGTRRMSLRENYRNEGVIDDETLYLNGVSAIAFGSGLSLFCILVGFVDGLSKGSGNPFEVIAVLFFGLVFIGGLFNLFTIIDYLRKKVPDRFWDIYYGRW